MARSAFDVVVTVGAALAISCSEPGPRADDPPEKIDDRRADARACAETDRPDVAHGSFPDANPYSYEKAILGKILFWDEQLSSDDTVACGTCHQPRAGGSDPRAAKTRHPGADHVRGTPDDPHGSAGIVRCRDANGAIVRTVDPIFGTNPQVTRRKAPSYLGAMDVPALFWDGSAGGTFRDPEDASAILIASGGALESQAALPLLNDAEMACEGRTWASVTAKLAAVRPLAKATALPADMSAALCRHRTYPELFEAAFGVGGVRAASIAMAIATYERTLVPAMTPYDRALRGDATALTPVQKRGRDVFFGRGCTRCHSLDGGESPFTNLGFHPDSRLGLDQGRAETTRLVSDVGRFRAVSLRNVGLREEGGLLHDGTAVGLDALVRAYSRPPIASANTDPTMKTALDLSAVDQAALVDFLRNGLTDPRAKDEQYPFDRPKLSTE